MDKKLQDSLSKIKLLICDIDGVLTDGSFVKSTSGDELRSFNALDGVGFVTLRLLNLNIKNCMDYWKRISYNYSKSRRASN